MEKVYTSYDNMDNYKALSNISFLPKILKKVVANRLKAHI